MRVLVTGATGHIGSNTVRAALEIGWDVVALARPGSRRTALEGLEVEIREGDLLDAEAVARAVQGVEAVLHVGAVHRQATADPDLLIRPAVEGTRHVLEAASKAGVGRVVVTSSGATVGFGLDPDHPLDESHRLETAKSAYTRAKIEQEKLALSWVGKPGAPEIVVLNPSGVLGPYDYRITPATRSILGLLGGDPAFLALCPTDVRDVGAAHVLAAERGRPGERYLITGDVVKPKQLAALFGELTGVRPLTIRPPAFLLKLAIGGKEKQAIRDGGDTAASRDAVDDLAGGHLVYDSKKSREELGMRYRPAREVLVDTLRWLLFVNVLAPKVAARVRAKLGERAAPDPDWVPPGA
ncbi:MAG: NAD-dependent epimerase/dehydratase family protein [Polyangiales bacterium]